VCTVVICEKRAVCRVDVREE